MAWHAVQTQWHHAGMVGLRTGLDYAGVCAYLQAHGYRSQPAGRKPGRGGPSLGTLLDDLRVCEAVALEEWRQQAARQRGSR